MAGKAQIHKKAVELYAYVFEVGAVDAVAELCGSLNYDRWMALAREHVELQEKVKKLEQALAERKKS